MKARSLGALLFAAVVILSVGSPAYAADLGIKNGDFTNGKQFWKGEGVIVSLPDGNKVLELDSTDRKQSDVFQEIEMGQLNEVEVQLRARFIGTQGQMRAKLRKNRGGSVLFAFDLSPNGEWRELKFKYVRDDINDSRDLVIETLPYEGKLQIDDIWAGEPGTHPSVRPLTPTSSLPPIAPKSVPTSPLQPVAPKSVPASPPPVKGELGAFAGAWDVTYTNNAVRRYRVSASGQVQWLTQKEPVVTSIIHNGADYLVDFGDGKLERWSLNGNTLTVEHFNPKTLYPNERPKQTGVALRAK